MYVEPVVTGSATVAERSDKYGGKVPVAVKADGVWGYSSTHSKPGR